MRSLSSRIRQVEKALATIETVTDRQIFLLQFLEKETGSFFSGINLTDELGRVVAGVAWPMTPEREKIIIETRENFNALLLVSSLYELMWKKGDNVAFALPTKELHSSPAYALVYRPLRMNYMAWYLFPPAADKRRILVVLSSDKKTFSRRDVRALQKTCTHFSSEFFLSSPTGERFSRCSILADHTALFNAKFHSLHLPSYFVGLINTFYGQVTRSGDHQILPPVFQEDIRAFQKELRASLMPTQEGIGFSFSKPSQGRILNITVMVLPDEQFSISCYEDLRRARSLQEVKNACLALKRDEFYVWKICKAILDGVKETDQLRVRAGLSLLAPKYSLHLISDARRVLRHSFAG